MGPVAFALSWNDGFYSDHFTLSDRVGDLDGRQRRHPHLRRRRQYLATDHTINLSTGFFNFSTPEPAGERAAIRSLLDLDGGPWVINPYIQYTHTPAVTILNGAPPVAFNSGSTIGGALLVGYSSIRRPI